MINVNDKLIREELPHIGSDALTILLVIGSHLGVNQTAWPGLDRIRRKAKVEVNGELKDMSRKRAYNALNKLEERGHITRTQVRGEDGVFSHTVYTVSEKYLSVYVKASPELEDNNRVVESRNTDNRNTDNRNTEKRPLSINKNRSINKEEVLINKEAHSSACDEKEISFKQPDLDFEKFPWERATDFLMEKFKTHQTTRSQIKAAKDSTEWKGTVKDFRKLAESLFRDAENNREKYGRLLILPDNEEKYWAWLSKVMARLKTFMEFRVRDQKKDEPKKMKYDRVLK